MEDDLKQTVIKEQSAGKNVRKRTNKSPRKKRVIASKGKLDINKKTTVGNKISSFNPFLSESQKEILLNRLLTRLNKTVPDENKTHEDYKKRRTTFPNKSNVTLDRKLITSPANFSGSFDYPPVDETENYNMAYLEQKRQNVLRQILKEQEEKAKYPKTLFSKFTNLGKQLRREIYRDLSILYDEDTLFDNQTQNKKINDVIKLLSSEYSTQKKEKNPRNISNQGPKLNADERGLLERELIESSQRLKESLRYKKMNQRYPMREITKYYKSLYQITSHLLGDDLKMSPFEENENSLEMKLLISVMRLREKYHVSGITLQEVYKKIQHYQDEDEKKKEKIVVISETASVEDQCENKKPDEVKNRIDDKIKKLPKKHTKKMNKKQNIKKVEVKVVQNNVPNKTEKMEEKKSEPIVPIVTKFVRPSDLVDEKSDLSSKDSEFKEIDLKDLSLEEIIEHLKLRINEIDAAKKEKTEKTKPPSLCEIDVNNFIPLTELNLKQKNLDEVEPEPIRKVRDFLESLEPPENFVSSQNKKFVENNTKSISSSFKVTSKHYSIQFSNIVVSLEMKKTSNLLFNMKENKKILDEEEEKRQEQIDKDPFTLYILNKYLQLLTPDGNFTSYSLYPIEISPEAKISKQSNYLLDQIHANDGMIKRTTSQINRKNMAPVKKKKSFMKKCFRKYLKNNLFQRSMNSFQYNLKEIINLGNFNELVSNVPKRAEYGCKYIGTDKVLYSFIDHLKTYSEKSIKHFHDRSEIDVVELQTFLHSNLQRLSVNTLQTEMRSPVSKKSRSLNSGKNSRKSGSYIIPPGQVKCKNVPLIELPLKRMHQMTAKLMQSNQRIHERKDVALSSICLGRSNACCQTKSAPINDQTTQWLSTSSLSVYKSCASNIGSISQTHTLRDSQLFYPKKFTSRRNNYGSLNWHLANHSPDDVHVLTKNSVYKKESHPPLKVLFFSRQFHQELNPKVYKKSRSFKQNDTPLARFVKTHGLPKLPHKWNWIKKHFTRENNRNRIFKKATIDMTLPITRRKEHILVNKLFRLGLTSAKLRAAGLFIDDVFHMAREFHTIAQKGIFCRDLTLKYGIRCKDLKAFGLCCRDLKHGITRDHLTAFGFTQDKLKQAGISEADLVQLGVKLEMLPGDDSSSSDDNYYCKMKDKKIFENKNKRKKSNKLNENSKKINFNEKEQIRRRADKTGSGKWPIAAMFATKRRFVRIDDNNVTIRMLHRTFGDIIPTPPKEMPGTMSFQELK